MKRSHRSDSSSLMRRSPLAIALGATLAVITTPGAQALQLEYRLKATAAGVADGGRDLGLTGADATREGYLDVTPWVHLQFNDDWAAFVRARGYLPTGSLLQPGNDDDGSTITDKGFVGLREAWVEYGGLTSYPGEVLRVGRQRIRNDDAQFIDQDIEAARWIFDTTKLDAQLGVAHAFSGYRSDNADVPRERDDRTYWFGQIDWDWQARQRIGIRAMHAVDEQHEPAIGEPLDPRRRATTGDLSWIGVYADSHAWDWRALRPDGDPFAYWGSVTLLTGDRERPVVDAATGPVSGRVDEGARAWAADTGVRARIAGPLKIGAAYSYSGGGSGDEADRQYEQSGVQSNYSRYTGTRSLIYRYNEAYRPETGNLETIAGFASLSTAAYDASLIYQRIRRPQADSPVVTDGVRVSPSVESQDLGQGVDLVMTRYFSLKRPFADDLPEYTPSDDAAAQSLRLRASWFDPGKAYGPAADADYRVMMEMTLWY